MIGFEAIKAELVLPVSLRDQAVELNHAVKGLTDPGKDVRVDKVGSVGALVEVEDSKASISRRSRIVLPSYKRCCFGG